MNVWIRRTLQVGVVAAGALAVSATGASAGDVVTYDNYGIGNGNQAIVPVQLPVNVCGNAVGVLGDAEAGCDGGSSATMKAGELGDLVTYDNYGIGNGNQLVVPVQAPIDVCGNAVAAGGDADAGCKGGSSATMKMAKDAPSLETYDNYGIGNGNQLVVPVQAPINVCGNAIAVLGDAEAGCKGGSEATMKSAKGGPSLETHDNYGIGNGNQAVVPIQLPINVCGNAVAAGGDAEAGCKGGSEATMKHATHPSLHSYDNYGIGNGNQAVVPVQIPIEISGNAASLAGDAEAESKGGAGAWM